LPLPATFHLTTAAVCLVAWFVSPAGADWDGDRVECLRNDAERRVEACSRLIRYAEKASSVSKEKLVSLYLARGNALLANREFGLAEADFSHAIELAPSDPTAFHNRGLTFFERKRYNSAWADFDRATQINPKLSRPWNERGRILLAKKEFEKAIFQFTKAIELEPDNYLFLSNRAVAQHKLGNYREAISDYDEAIATNPQDAFSLNRKAFLLSSAHESKYRNGAEAERLARNAIQIESRNPEYRATLAVALAENGAFDQAITIMKSLEANSAPGTVEIYRHMLTRFRNFKAVRCRGDTCE
jgi:tetratricopeptide (TPR) repeat protein